MTNQGKEIMLKKNHWDCFFFRCLGRPTLKASSVITRSVSLRRGRGRSFRGLESAGELVPLLCR